MRRLPFALAHIEPFVLGGTAPIDAVCCLARDERAKLPEGLASARAPASMDAMHDACGGFFRACAEAWKTPRQFKRMVLVTAPGAAFTFVEKPDFRHQSTGLCGELGNEIAHTQAFGARGEGQRHAMLEHWDSKRHDIVEGRR